MQNKSLIIQYYKSLDIYKKGFWLYLILLFIEGAMRKWFMPSLSNLWMVCREPIVIFTVLALISTKYNKGFMQKAFMVIGVMTFFTTLLFGHHDMIVAFYGFRIWFFHLPYIFIMANKLNRDDLYMICRFLITVFIPMTILYVAQWASPPNIWINASVGGIVSESDQIANGAVRPSGTFGHGVGASYYNPIVVCIFVTMMVSKYYSKLFSIINYFKIILSIAVITMLITSVSRGTIIQSALTFIFISIVYAVYTKPQNIFRLILTIVFLFAIFSVMTNISIDGKNLLSPVTSRFESASETEGGVSGIMNTRVLEPFRFWQEKGRTLNPNFWGYGIGAGSNFGTQKLNLGNAWGLGEWSAQIVSNEMGLLFGGLVFFLRIGFCIYLLPQCLKKVKLNHDILPISLWTLSITYFAIGNINLTMTLGWIVVIMIILLLSLKGKNTKYRIHKNLCVK